MRAEPDKPHHLWGLTEEGQRAAAALADDPALQQVSVFASSSEPKAIETAAAMARGRPVVEVEALGELDRSAAGWIASEQERTELVRAIFENPTVRIRGCESADHALARFAQAVDELVAQYASGGLAIVSHGTVLALYIAHVRGLRTPEIGAWRAIRLPDVGIVDPVGRTVLRDFG